MSRERLLDGDAGFSSVLRPLDLETIRGLLKHLTIRFHLRNKAEQIQIVRINRQREMQWKTPRSESIREAIAGMGRRGVTGDAVSRLLGRLDIQPTLTAHPTETRRRSVLLKQRSLGDCLERQNRADLTPLEHQRNQSEARQNLALLFATDEIRSRRLTVLDEIRNGLHHLREVIWHAVALIHRDLADAMEESFGMRPSPTAVLRYRSWIGGDRDENPFVTAEITRKAIEMRRSQAITLWLRDLALLQDDLSVSIRRARIPQTCLDAAAHDALHWGLPDEQREQFAGEPLRLRIAVMKHRLRGDATYNAASLREDLSRIAEALEVAGLIEVAQKGRLWDMRIRADSFGLHLASLDIRQHCRVHTSAVTELLRIGGVCNRYSDLSESDRIKLLGNELVSSRPLRRKRAESSEELSETLATLELISQTNSTNPEAIGSLVLSMTQKVSHLLEALLLMREVGLLHITRGSWESDLDIVPLFETVDDLRRSPVLMRALFDSPIYKRHLRARDGFQEIMLGYSDSNKDGGYISANWNLHTAQRELARVCRRANVAFRFFHGRGGTVARGGGRANRAILSAPSEARSGRLRFTEQGEVITFRYGHSALARRHLEQIVNAAILAESPDDSPHNFETEVDGLDSLMDRLASSSMRAYREFVDAPGFWEWFIQSSLLLHIGSLPIASRPVTRDGGSLTFQTIRAIPWVFSWTQMRATVPGWYGLGTAFFEHVRKDARALALCRDAYQKHGFFRSLIDNAQQEMARTRLEMTRAYDTSPNGWVTDCIAEEFDRSRDAVLAITGQQELLDNNRVIQESIRERNPETDLLNLLQVELLRRWHDATDEERHAELRLLLQLSINGIAAAMQSTG